MCSGRWSSLLTLLVATPVLAGHESGADSPWQLGLAYSFNEAEHRFSRSLRETPDTRSDQLGRAAALLNARLTQWSLPDIQTPWPDRDALIRQLADVIAMENPEMILTFDPDHGTTGHPAHKETGSLVLDAGADGVYQLETQAEFVGEGFALTPARDGVWTYDPGSDWEYAVRDAEIHASQFSPAQVESLRTLPPEMRRVWLRPADLTAGR